MAYWDFTFGVVWCLVHCSLGLYFWLGTMIGASISGTLLLVWYGDVTYWYLTLSNLSFGLVVTNFDSYLIRLI